MARSKGHGSLLPQGLGDTGRSRRLSDDERARSRTCANITRKIAVHVSLGRFHWNGCLGRIPDLPEALLRRQPSLSKPGEMLSRSSGRRGGSRKRPCRKPFEEEEELMDGGVSAEMLRWDTGPSLRSAPLLPPPQDRLKAQTLAVPQHHNGDLIPGLVRLESVGVGV